MVARESSMELRQRVKYIIINHKGRHRVITALEISKIIRPESSSQNTWFVRQAIRDLIAEGIPIAAAVDSPPGYFIVETNEEAEAYVETEKHRIVGEVQRIRDFRKAVRMNLVPVQGSLL